MIKFAALMALYKSKFKHKENKNHPDELSICCINCGDDKFHLGINFTSGVYHCFKCSWSGRLSYLTKKILNVNPEWYVDTSIMKAREKTVVKSKLKPIGVPADFRILTQISYNPTLKPYFDYLIARRVSLTQADHFSIGYAPRTLPGYIIFPIKDPAGSVLYWTSRSVHKSAVIKTKNPPSAPGEAGRADVLFGIDDAIRYNDVLITEGVFDCISIGRGGVALLGKTISDQQFKILFDANFDTYTIALDRDAISKAYQIADKFRLYGKKVYIVKYPDDRDLNELYIDDDIFKIEYYDYKGLRGVYSD